MKTTRRGLFGLIAGAVGVAVFGKEAHREPHVYATNVEGTDVRDLGPARDFTITSYRYIAFEIDDLKGGMEA